MMDVVEIKPVGSEAGGWSQLNQPTRTSYAAIGAAAEKQGVMGVVTYNRETGVIHLTAKEINGMQREVYSGQIGQLTSEELATLWKESGGNTAKFGNLVEGHIRERISQVTGQKMFDPLKDPSATGPDWLPQQLPLPHSAGR
jgi:hypothetical protein